MYRGLCLADVHIGAMSYEHSCDELAHIKSVLKEFTKDDLLDFIIVAGDFFEKQLYTSDPFIDLAQRFMITLIASTRILRVVYGTASHESRQYSLFDPLTTELPKELDLLKFDFKVITTVTEEELLPGLQVLYIPEEYIYDKRSYYNEYLQKEDYYGFIFGHGMIREAFNGRIDKSKNENTTRKKAPIFSSGELSYACHGEVIFGHYHIHTEMDDNVSYVGSLSRWKQGEEEEKGFYLLGYDFDKRKAMKRFIINTAALLYATISYGYGSDVFNEEKWEETSQVILKTRLKKNIYRLRVIFNIPVGYEKSESFMAFFRDRFKDQQHISIEFSNGYVMQKLKSANERVEALPEELKLFIDANVPTEVKYSEFIKMKRGISIPPEEIKKYIDEYETIDDIVAMITKELDL